MVMQMELAKQTRHKEKWLTLTKCMIGAENPNIKMYPGKVNSKENQEQKQGDIFDNSVGAVQVDQSLILLHFVSVDNMHIKNRMQHDLSLSHNRALIHQRVN